MDKTMRKYIKSVERRLNLPKDIKKRVMSDFESDMIARREAGMSDEEILTEFGKPKKAASDLNEQMKEFVYRKSPWRFVFAALAAYGAVELLDKLVGYVLLTIYRLGFFSLDPDAASIGIIGGADGPTAVFVTTSAPAWYHFVLPVVLMGVGIWGFLRLRKCKQK